MSSLTPLPTRVACYARVSTEDQAERQTVTAQTDFLRRYCDLHGLPVAGVYVDDGISGTVPLEDRPEGRRLLQDAQDGAFSVVLVYRLDRLGRSLKSLLDAHDRLDKAGVAIRSGTEPFDTASPIGRFLFSLLGSMAELERSTIEERMTRGRDRVARNGQYTGGPVPFGYDLDASKRLRPSDRRVDQLDMTEAELVRDIFGRIADGETTMNAECHRLTALGVPRVQRYGANTKKGAPARVLERSGGWGFRSLAVIVHNPVYKGAGVLESKHGDLERPATPLVDPETWERAQRALLANRNLSKREGSADYVLRGLVKCGGCGLAFCGAMRFGVRKYRCNSNSGQALRNPVRCPGGQIDAQQLEDLVWNEVRTFARNPGPYVEAAQRQLRERLTDASRSDEQRRRLAAELAGKEQERERVLGLFRRGRISTDEVERELEEIAGEARKLREMLDTFRVQAEMTAASEAYLSDVSTALARLSANLELIEERNDTAEKRRQIELLVPRIVVQTEVVGTTPKGRNRTRVTVKMQLAYGYESAAEIITRRLDADCRTSPDQEATLRIERELVLAR